MDFIFATANTGPVTALVPTIPALLTSLVTIYFASKIGGELAVRLKQPPVLGELLAGLAVGTSGFGIVNGTDPILLLFAQIGVILLLFEIGLESDFKSLLKVGPQAFAVALIGMIAPFGLGYAIMAFYEATVLQCIFVGAAMTATSIGISAKVLADCGYLQRTEGRIILGAAVIDDILGVVLLSLVTTIAGGATISWLVIAGTAGASIGFLLLAIVVGTAFVPFFLKIVRRLQTRGDLLIASLVFAFFLSIVAEKFGSAAIIGAFAAGLLLSQTDKRHDLEEQLRPVTDFFLPIFFITVGASVDLAVLRSPTALTLAIALTAAAIAGKVASGIAAYGVGAKRMAIGAGMIPRGEVGLVFASVGLASGVLIGAYHSAVVIMVIATTFIGPALLGLTLREKKVEEV